MFEKQIFADRLTKLLEKQNIKPSQLAKIAGITKQSIHTLQIGKTTPKLETICIIAEYLHVSIDYLVGRTNNPELNK
ncbi:XRE family transcriptional regulator (plasmid) [Brevibacillus laterosporus]|nr:helix-turn-helix transcriptional regulator [Brevibacillus laterosporus]TPG93555.1 XRE family transcriptional regulator [Brevibacillus laterosporus]